MRRTTSIISLLALIGSGCALINKPSEPHVLGLRLTKLSPGTSDGDKVMVPIELSVLNPNEHELEIRAERIRIISDADARRTLGVASFETPVVVGPGKIGDHVEPQLAETTLGVDRDSWDRSIFKTIRDGEARIVGPVTVLYRGRTYNTQIDVKLPGRDAATTEEGEPLAVLALEMDLDRLELAFESLSTIRIKAELDADSDVGQAIRLTQVALTIGAPASKRPLALDVDRAILIPAEGSGRIKIEGRADLTSCDPTLLDDIEAAGRRAIVRISGTAASEGFPETDFDEHIPLTFPGAGGEEDGPEVVLRRPDVALLSKIVGAAEQGDSFVHGLETLARLSRFEPVPVRFALENPIPGSLRIDQSEVILLGPKNPEKNRRLEIVSFRMNERTLGPRARTDVQADLHLLPDGGKTWKAVALDASKERLFDYCLASRWKLFIPVFGEVTSEKTLGPVYTDSTEACE